MELRMQTSYINYDACGMQAKGYLAVPDGDGPWPGVLVCHEGPGQDDHVRSRADRIATELGFVAFALDYHGEGRIITDFQSMRARLDVLREDLDVLREIAAAGLKAFCDNAAVLSDWIAVTGYCFGGTVALELGRSGADVKAVIAHRAQR